MIRSDEVFFQLQPGSRAEGPVRRAQEVAGTADRMPRVTSRDNPRLRRGRAARRLVARPPQARQVRARRRAPGRRLPRPRRRAGNAARRRRSARRPAHRRARGARCRARDCWSCRASLFARDASSLPADVGVARRRRRRRAPAMPRAGAFHLLLDDVQDPGNVGSMLRTAAAAGVEQVLLSKHCAFAWSPKVLRAGQGAHFADDDRRGRRLAGMGAAFAASGGARGRHGAARREPTLRRERCASRGPSRSATKGAGLSAALAASARRDASRFRCRAASSRSTRPRRRRSCCSSSCGGAASGGEVEQREVGGLRRSPEARRRGRSSVLRGPARSP